MAKKKTQLTPLTSHYSVLANCISNDHLIRDYHPSGFPEAPLYDHYELVHNWIQTYAPKTSKSRRATSRHR